MKYFAVTDKGLVRKQNQDNYIIAYNECNDVLAIVCDGIGGNKAGDVASYEAITYFSELFSQNSGFNDVDDAITFLKKSIEIVNYRIFMESQTTKSCQGMGTTLTGILITKEFKIVINVGDSRVYVVNEKNDFVQITEDHNYGNELLKKHVSIEEVNKDPRRFHLTRALGIYPKVEADFYLLNTIEQYVLITSDGLHDYVSGNIIKQELLSDHSLNNKVDNLLKGALNNGGLDNITIILIQFGKEDYE